MASNDPTSGNPSRGLIGRRGGNRGGRLPSLRGPRDLTLGGVQKKTFVPNIPVRPKDRKEEPKDNGSTTNQQITTEGKKQGKHDRVRGRGRGRGERGGRGGRGRGERDVIQSHSIFEQGPAGDSMRSKSSWGGAEPAERSTTRTSSSIKKEKREPEETKRILDELMRDDFVAGTQTEEDPSLIPIKLPLCDFKTEIKKEEKDVKDELKDEDDESEEMSACAKASIKTESPPRPKTAAQLFTTHLPESEELFFVQLPDTLPGEPPETDDQKDKKPVLKTVEEELMTNPEDELAKKLGLASLRQFSEGYIGKIQVRESGKTTLVLGNVELDISIGTPCGFLQDVVSIKIDEERKEGDMMVLGHVKNKIVCVPDFEKMMDS